MGRARLLELVRASVHRGQVTLASGATSDFYVDGRLVTLSPEGSLLAGQALLEAVREWGATALGGPTTGACPLVSATGVLAAQAGLPLKLFYVRSEPKAHGLRKAIEGAALGPEDRVVLVEDVLTSGGSVLRAVERVRAETPARVLGVITLVDREAGGRQAVEAAGLRLQALFTRAELQDAARR